MKTLDIQQRGLYNNCTSLFLILISIFLAVLPGAHNHKRAEAHATYARVITKGGKTYDRFTEA